VPLPPRCKADPEREEGVYPVCSNKSKYKTVLKHENRTGHLGIQYQVCHPDAESMK
jgi:hypothetical protein